MRITIRACSLIILCAALAPVPAISADAPEVKATMVYKPVHYDEIEYDVPTPAQYAACKVTVVREGKQSGWVVTGPAGQTIRRFMDTNADNVVDQWSYYRNGLEVYRDLDSNANNKVDQSRWLNTGGMRWGIDANEDGRIDTWKMISAEEVSRIAVRALVAQDAAMLTPVLITKQDLRDLGISGDLETKLLEAASDPAAKLRKYATGSKLITPKTTWMRFDNSNPSIIPADQLKLAADLMVYENGMAVVDTGATAGGQPVPGVVLLGELVRVGDAWKLTMVPQPMDGPAQITEAGLIMSPTNAVAGIGAAAPATAAVAPALQKLVEKLMEIDKRAPQPSAGRTEFVKYNQERADLLEQLRAESKTAEDRNLWTRQLADGITANVQIGVLPTGVERLMKLESEVRKQEPADSPLIAFVTYRRMVADYSVKMEQAKGNEDRQKIQELWMKELEQYAARFPRGEDTPDAMLQIAIAEEFAGKKEAPALYERIVSQYPESAASDRAKGAVARLNLVGKPLNLSGANLDSAKGALDLKEFRGKTVLVLFWATWCKPCTQDLPAIKDLYERYRSRGFEIIGINLDSTPEPVRGFLQEHRVTWPQIYETGSLESPLARSFGIISLPTMFILDRDGKVSNRSASVDDLKAVLTESTGK